MKRLVCILLCLITCLSLAACSPGGYLNSTDGDITVSLPEPKDPTLPEFTEEQKLILGKWTLVSITEGETVITPADSYYNFANTGTCTVVLDGEKATGSFKFNDGSLYIDGEKVTYVIEDDTLTITTPTKVHLLTKAAEEPEEPQE